VQHCRPVKAHHNVHQRLDKMRHWLRLDKMPKMVRIAVVSVVGGAFLIAGIVMIVTPGPAFVFIPLGLFLLASEFKWAETCAQKLMDAFDKAREKWRERKRRRAAQAKP
jgi:uncharacterized protein (TIGR02611 family)